MEELYYAKKQKIDLVVGRAVRVVRGGGRIHLDWQRRRGQLERRGELVAVLRRAERGRHGEVDAVGRPDGERHQLHLRGGGPYVQRVRYLWTDDRRYKTGRFTSANAPAHVEGNGAILVLGDGSGLKVIIR